MVHSWKKVVQVGWVGVVCVGGGALELHRDLKLRLDHLPPPLNSCIFANDKKEIG